MMKNGLFLNQKYLKDLMTELEHKRKLRRKQTGDRQFLRDAGEGGAGGEMAARG